MVTPRSRANFSSAKLSFPIRSRNSSARDFGTRYFPGERDSVVSASFCFALVFRKWSSFLLCLPLPTLFWWYIPRYKNILRRIRLIGTACERGGNSWRGFLRSEKMADVSATFSSQRRSVAQSCSSDSLPKIPSVPRGKMAREWYLTTVGGCNWNAKLGRSSRSSENRGQYAGELFQYLTIVRPDLELLPLKSHCSTS